MYMKSENKFIILYNVMLCNVLEFVKLQNSYDEEDLIYKWIHPT